MLGYPRIGGIVQSGGRKSVRELWKLQDARKQWRARLCEMWRSQDLDAVICPATVTPACPTGTAAELSALCCYTAFYNAADFPAGVVPVSCCTAQDEEALAGFPSNKRVADPWDKKAADAARGAVGLPLGVQVVGLPWDDEVCLGVMKQIESSPQIQQLSSRSAL